MLSVYHLTRIRVEGQTQDWLGRGGWRQARQTILQKLSSGMQWPRPDWKHLLRLDVMRGPFGRFLAAYLLFYTFQYVPIPLFPIYLVHDLSLRDGDIGLGTAIFQLMITATSLFLGRIAGRVSHRKQLIASALVFGQYPLLLYLARDAGLYWLASVIGGVIFATLSVGLLNRLMERVPEDDRPAHMALHNLVFSMGVLVGSFVGPLLAGWIGLRQVLLVSAGLRVAAGVMMIFWV
jgi:MFS family permease